MGLSKISGQQTMKTESSNSTFAAVAPKFSNASLNSSLVSIGGKKNKEVVKEQSFFQKIVAFFSSLNPFKSKAEVVSKKAAKKAEKKAEKKDDKSVKKEVKKHFKVVEKKLAKMKEIEGSDKKDTKKQSKFDALKEKVEDSFNNLSDKAKTKVDGDRSRAKYMDKLNGHLEVRDAKAAPKAEEEYSEEQ